MPAGPDKHRSPTELAFAALAGAFGAPGDGATSTISLGASAAAATGLTEGAVYMVVATQNCHVIFDTSAAGGDATTSDARLVADIPYFFRMSSGVDRCSAIESGGSGGTLYLTKLGG